jgi:hypothetical protein
VAFPGIAAPTGTELLIANELQENPMNRTRFFRLFFALAFLLPAFGQPAGAQSSEPIGARALPNYSGTPLENYLASLSPRQIFHVSPSGNDLNSGSSQYPWKTIGKAARTLQAGQAAYVHTGTYTEDRITPTNAGSPGLPIWLMEAPGEKVVLRGTLGRDAPFFVLTQSWWVLDGFTIDAAGQKGNAVRMQANYLLVNGIHAKNGTGPQAVSISKARDVVLLNSQIHDYRWTDSSGARKDSHGITVQPDCANVLIRGNASWGNSGDAVQCLGIDHEPGTFHPKDITIEGNRFGSSQPAAEPQSLEIVADFENAIDLKSCRYVTVRGNKLMGYRAHAGETSGGAAIVAHYQAHSVLIEYNRIWNCGMAASLGSGTNLGLGDVVFRRNLIFDMKSENGKGRGVYVALAQSVEIYFNTFYNVSKEALNIGPEGLVEQALVINNIVMGAGSGLVLYRSNIPSLIVQRNLFWMTSASIPSGSIVADPRFVTDPINYDFYTQANSPARDIALWAPTGETYYGSGPDIGFLESP